MSEENAVGRSASHAKDQKTGGVSCEKMLRTVPLKTVEALAWTSRKGLPGHDAPARGPDVLERRKKSLHPRRIVLILGSDSTVGRRWSATRIGQVRSVI